MRDGMPLERARGHGSPPRIFWLGMHKILVETEFRLLQNMGYEVFRPPYLTSIVDQSVSTSTDFGNATLPEDVRARLSGYNFFYNTIGPEIAALLNEHFDAVVVTINPDWLKTALNAFTGIVIYRCYGQLGLVSASLTHNGCRSLITQRESFHFLPHAPECLDDEFPWLVERATVVPYWLTRDVLEFRGAWWRATQERRASVALTCPNIKNSYYNAHFRYLKRFFEERCFRYYGVQIEPNADPNVVGTLKRDEQLSRLATESGFLYTYRERNVCYLPPIEMMVMGGPVLYFPESLLARYFGERTPGLVRDEAEAIAGAKRLIAGDSGFISEIVASQSAVAYRYMPAFGEAVFRAELDRILPLSSPPANVLWASSSKRVLVIAHVGGYIRRNGEFASIHGIPRVMRQFVRALNEFKVPVTVTFAGGDRAEILGFYASGCEDPSLVDAIDFADVIGLATHELRAGYEYAVVAHYHFFPEANDLDLPLLAYVPDYLPHFFEGRGWFEEVQSDIDCGRTLVSRARLVLTNSSFSEKYLPGSKLHVAPERIRMFPLPFLGSADTRAERARPSSLPAVLEDDGFIFYPTQPHPHKRLDLLVMAWLLVNQNRSNPIRLVLTTGVIAPRLLELIEAVSMGPWLLLLPELEDASVEWLYSRARCLAFSSELEGNFPTQVLEALHLDCPVVCTDNPLIITELGELALYLQVAPFGDVAEFAQRISYCVDHRDCALRTQRLASRQILQRFSYENFRSNVASLHRRMKSEENIENEQLL
jgi:glycosyltransferase involved in cell wall biosynthesis